MIIKINKIKITLKCTPNSYAFSALFCGFEKNDSSTTGSRLKPLITSAKTGRGNWFCGQTFATR